MEVDLLKHGSGPKRIYLFYTTAIVKRTVNPRLCSQQTHLCLTAGAPHPRAPERAAVFTVIFSLPDF